MKLIPSLLIIVLLLSWGWAGSPNNCEEEFRIFQIKYDRNYTADEFEQRKAIFLQNCQMILDNNNNPNRSCDLSINSFADQNEKEAQGRLGLGRGNIPRRMALSMQAKRVGESPLSEIYIPPYLDYYSKGYVSKVKNQGSCGSCWAFATTAVYESKLLLFGHNYTLSEEAVIECTNSFIDNGDYNSCNGGYIDDALTYLNLRGGVLSSKYPYTSFFNYYTTPETFGICNDNMRYKLGQGSIINYFNQNLSVTQIKQLLVQHGPVAVGIYANSPFQFYYSGVFDACSSSTSIYNLNHAVLLYGWDIDGNWLIKNSWGTFWGENGFMRLSSKYDCGIRLDLGTINFNFVYQNPFINIDNEVLPS